MVWLNAGDFYQGTVWYTQFKWRVVSLFNNLLDFDAMTLGNHEFDDKIAGLEPFLRNQSTAVVVANINTSLVRAANEPSRSFNSVPTSTSTLKNLYKDSMLNGRLSRCIIGTDRRLLQSMSTIGYI